MDEDIIVTLKRSNDLLMTFGNDYSDVFLPAIDEINRLRNTAKEFNLMRRGLECIANSEDASVPNHVRKFAHVILGKGLVVDIVERLREYNEPPFDYIAHEAAAKIEDLRFAWDTTSAECNKLIIEIERLRDALADIANIVNPYEDGDTMQEIARAALKEKE